MLQGHDSRNTSIHRIGQASLSLIAHGDNSFMATGGADAKQELRHIAGAEHLVDGGEAGGALVGAEVRGKDASSNTLPAEELASPTWRVGVGGGGGGGGGGFGEAEGGGGVTARVSHEGKREAVWRW